MNIELFRLALIVQPVSAYTADKIMLSRSHWLTKGRVDNDLRDGVTDGVSMWLQYTRYM